MTPAPNSTKTPETKKPNIWLITTIILAIALIAVLSANLSKPDRGDTDGEGELTILSSDEASTDLINFINQVYGPQLGPATLKGVEEENGLYKATVGVTNQGEPVDQIAYITRDGKLFIPQAINIDDALAQLQELIQQQQNQPPAAPPEAPLVDDTEPTEDDTEPTEDDTEPTEE